MSEIVKQKVSMVSLGCPKNLVDAEVMLGVLSKQEYEITMDEKEADVIIVNTCSFIKEAKQESIDAILDLAERKHDGKCHTLIVSGCLPQRYQEELAKELPEAMITASLPSAQRYGLPGITYSDAGILIPAMRHLYYLQ